MGRAGFTVLVMTALALTGCSQDTEASDPASSATSGNAAGSTQTGVPAKVTVRNFESTSPQAWAATFQVISGAKGAILIDPGKYDKEVADYVKSVGGVQAIMITHGHWDKVRGLEAAMKANPKAVAYINKLDQPYLKDPVRNCSIEDGFKGTTDAKTTTFTEGKRTIAGYAVEITHLPGHTQGASIFHFPDENILIGGDTIMADSVGSSRHPGGDEKERQASIAKFKAMKFPADMKIYDGHDQGTTYAELMKNNTDLQ